MRELEACQYMPRYGRIDAGHYAPPSHYKRGQDKNCYLPASAKAEGSGALVWSCCSGQKKLDGSNVNS
jgi:hypothetical protein